MTFDATGTTKSRGLAPGEQIDAFVMLDGPAAKLGIRGFDLQIRVSENIVVHQQALVGNGLNLSSDDAYIVGLNVPRRAAATKPLRLVHMRVSVTDLKPAYFWVEPSPVSDLQLPAVIASKGEVHTIVPLSGDVTEPVASLNDDNFALGGGYIPRPHLSMRIAPNPFNPMTEIHFQLPISGPIVLRVFDTRGQLVATLRDEVMAAGEHEVVWNGTDRNGQGVASGVYFSRLQTGAGILQEKMVLVR